MVPRHELQEVRHDDAVRAVARRPAQRIPDDGHVEAKCSMCGYEAPYTGRDLQHFWTKG
jgi:hypothetical protein